MAAHALCWFLLLRMFCTSILQAKVRVAQQRTNIQPQAPRLCILCADTLLQVEQAGPAKATLTAPASAWDGDWVLTLDQFAPGAVGQKAMSTTLMHKAAATASTAARSSGAVSQLPGWVKLPASVALPHGSFEAVLRAPLNRDMREHVEQLAGRIAAAAMEHPGNPEACAAELEQIRYAPRQVSCSS
jgi:hypothetical protein